MITKSSLITLHLMFIVIAKNLGFLVCHCEEQRFPCLSLRGTTVSLSVIARSFRPKQSDTKCHSEQSEESQRDCFANARNDFVGLPRLQLAMTKKKT